MERVGGDVREVLGVSGGTDGAGGAGGASGRGEWCCGARAAVAGKSPTVSGLLSGSVQLIGRKPSVARNRCPEAGRGAERPYGPGRAHRPGRTSPPDGTAMG
ncbi:hypothetical protein CP981_27005 [Streptomyces platensis]|uniref:Uncharacterized protein n=1 Tax=Streptomyces platensis TaxID=58346 RepID=A0AAE6TPD4_STRPT|nr:hypothetical protein CP981_27005 [Streptomyces platensis]